jgi:hypothetical protein
VVQHDQAAHIGAATAPWLRAWSRPGRAQHDAIGKAFVE